MKARTILIYLIVAVLSLVVTCYLTSCNVVNKSRSVEKKAVDSSVNKSFDSSKLLSHDSTKVSKVDKQDSSSHKHVDSKKLIINFDTNTPAIVNTDSSYHYIIDGKKITTPSKVTSAVIDDNSEDDSSSDVKDSGSDSVAVHNLDTGHVIKASTTHLQEQTKAVTTTKETKRVSPWFIGLLLILIIIGGYFGGKKLGFFK